jgi:hypothetical protein
VLLICFEKLNIIVRFILLSSCFLICIFANSEDINFLLTSRFFSFTLGVVKNYYFKNYYIIKDNIAPYIPCTDQVFLGVGSSFLWWGLMNFVLRVNTKKFRDFLQVA